MFTSKAKETDLNVENQPNAENIENVTKVKCRNLPQLYATFEGALLLTAGGMHMAFGLGWNAAKINYSVHMQICWFIGVIAGLLIVAPLVALLKKQIIFLFSTVLVLVSGIMFTAAPENYDMIIAARYINGLATGIVTIPYLVHTSEIASKSFRGFCVSMEQFGISLGMVIQIIYSYLWRIDFPANRVLGILTITCAVLAVITIFLFAESPIYYLRRNDDISALQCINQLYKPAVSPDLIETKLQEMQEYVSFNKQQTLPHQFAQSFVPLLKMLLYRSLLAFSISMPLTMATLWVSNVLSDDEIGYTPFLFAAERLIGTLMAFKIDKVGRKIMSLLNLLGMAGMYLGMGIILSNADNASNLFQMNVLSMLAFVSQVAAGFYDCCSSVYIAEAFPMQLKPYLMSICISLQHILYIITICTFKFSLENLYVFHITIAVLMFVFVIIFWLILPETKRITMKQAQENFQKTFYLKLR